jgi:hypothetical protein
LVEQHPDGVTVIARSNVEAYDVAADALGPDCTITNVEKIHQGGLGGFFATELVRVNAKRSGQKQSSRDAETVFASADELMTSLRSKAPNFADRLLDEWIEESGRQFDQPPPALQTRATASLTGPRPAPQRAAPRPTPALPTQTERPPAPVLTMPTPRGNPYVDIAATPEVANNSALLRQPRQVDKRWSPRALRAVGVPDRVVDLAMTSEPVTEGEWIVALMRALRGYCSLALTAPTVMIGSSCGDLAHQLRLVSIAAEELIETVSSVAVPNVGARAVAAGLNGRLVHLVVDGSSTTLTGVEAHVVSAASGADMLEALRVCVAWDGTLGWYWSGVRYDRLDEFTVVAHIRDLLSATEPVFMPS